MIVGGIACVENGSLLCGAPHDLQANTSQEFLRSDTAGACARYTLVMSLDLEPATLPLRPDAHGVIRVGGTRVTLESVLHAYLDGESADGIVERFPALHLADVHATIAWYLRHQADAEAYLNHAHAEAAAQDASPGSAGLRARLLARRPR